MLAVVVAGALAGCGRPGDGATDTARGSPGRSAAGTTTSSAAAPPQRIVLDTTPFTPPPRPATGQPDLSELIVTIEPVAYDSIAPAELLLMDPTGRRVGMEPATGRGLQEIPGATYDSMPPLTQTDGDREPGGLNRQVHLVTPPAGHYVLQVMGRHGGTYTLTFKLVTPRAESREVRVRGRQIREGELHFYRFTHDDRRGPLALR